MGFIKEFEKFISRGNVIDMAVGVVIGGAFGKIVNSLVVSIIMPLIGYLTNGMDFSKEAWVIQKADPEKNIAEIAVGYGDLIQVTLQFFIIALSIFVVLKLINNVKSRLEKAEPEVPAAPAAPSAEEKLLSEILEQLKKNGAAKETRCGTGKQKNGGHRPPFFFRL